MFAFIFLGICVLYATVLVFFAWVWQYKTPTLSRIFVPNYSLSKVCVVIPVRNEAHNLPALLSDLAKQNFPKEQLEIWVIDDHSEDETAEKAFFFQKEMPFLYYSKLKKEQKGKKAALTEALRQTTAEWIITTDADCRVGEDWVRTMHNFYQQTEAYMVSSLVTFNEPKNFWEKLQIVEFASLVGVGAVSLILGKASMANGANLAFRRDLFWEMGGYEGSETIASGDDEFLLRKFFRKYPKKVFFLKDQRAVVRTQASPDVTFFYEQRKRWASKWKLHQDWATQVLAISIFAFYLSIFWAFLGYITGSIKSPIILWAFLAKLLGEIVFLQPILIYLGYGRLGYGIGIWQFLYPVYAIGLGIGANVGKYIWKGRSY